MGLEPRKVLPLVSLTGPSQKMGLELEPMEKGTITMGIHAVRISGPAPGADGSGADGEG